MALPLGKLTLIVGAGLVGSVLAKEGRISNVSDFFSGAFKIVYKQLKQDDSTTSHPKPRNNSLMQQVNSLQEELQLLMTSNRSVTILTGDRSASGKYGVVVIVVVIGYGCIWWKAVLIASSPIVVLYYYPGWKLSDMMFATRRGLNDACSSVAKQLETVYSSISMLCTRLSNQSTNALFFKKAKALGAVAAFVTKRHLSSKIDQVDCKLDQSADNTIATREEVSKLRGDVKEIGLDFQSVHLVVRSLETKISRIEGRQNQLNSGVGSLVGFVQNLESRSMEQIEGAASSSFRPALELPRASPSRAVSLPIKASGEPPSPSTANGSRKRQSTFLPSNSASGLKELYGSSDDAGVSEPSIPLRSNGIHLSEETNIDSSTGGLFGRFSGLLTRSRSAQPSAK